MVQAAFSIAAVVIGLGYAVLWLRGWPTKRQSLAMAWLGGGIVAAGCVVQPQPVIALMGCTGVAILGGYAAFFHNTKAITVVVVFGIAAGVLCAIRVAAVDGWVVAAAGLWLVIELNLAVPLAIQTVVRTVGADGVRSDQDRLTGVLNRRAFYERGVGAAIVRWGCGPAMDELIRSADAAVYAAKRAGGNQTRICRPARVGG